MVENKVLAIVEGKEITEMDLDFLLRGLPQQQAMQFNSEEGRKQLLQELINQQLLYLDAKEKGLENNELYKKELEKTAESLLKQFAIRELLSNVEVTDEEIVEYYNTHKDQFKSEESVRSSHILVDSEETANEIYEKLNNGESFEEAAKEFSKCPSKEKGGDLGYFTKGKMVKEFEEASFELATDELSKPVKTQFGYHIIKVLDKKEAGFKSLEEVGYSISQQLTAMKQNTLYLEETNKLKNKYKIEVK